jgi:hypothetical protein
VRFRLERNAAQNDRFFFIDAAIFDKGPSGVGALALFSVISLRSGLSVMP